MVQPEVSVAWRLFSYNWLVLGLMALALAVALPLSGFSIKLSSTIVPFGICGAYVLVAYYKARRLEHRDPMAVFVLGSTGQILLIPVLMTPLTYIAASADLPMKDVDLYALDHALGLDWFTYFKFIYDRHVLLTATVWAYAMIGWPTFGIPVVLGITRRYRRLQEFTLAFALALIVTTVISTFVPAMGAYDLLNYLPDPDVFMPRAYVDYLREMPLVRNGTLRELDMAQLGGIVTFPSFHAAAAALYLWALWDVWWMRPLALLANVGMILATPVVGGHYFVDVFAGIAVAAVAVMAARQITGRLTRASTAPPDTVPASSGVFATARQADD
jgi:membrane-associated phospholipid phosphatase